MGPSDYLDQGGGSRCEQMVTRAAKLHQSSINFTPSLFWVDENATSRKSVNAAVSTHLATRVVIPQYAVRHPTYWVPHVPNELGQAPAS